MMRFKQSTFFIAFIICLAFNHWLQAQSGLQTVKGMVFDKQSEMPLIGATVELISTDNSTGTVTDLDGYFRLEEVPVGRQSLRISFLGYNTITLPNILVTSGKEVILDIGLEESIEELSEVVVKAEAQKDKAQNEMATISARTFSVEEVNRFSGGRSDVARLAANFAGVSTPDDSRNDIVIRGNSPTGLLWRLEGIPIPNPNHYATLGTTGGPVSALNPNLLKNSDFLTSAFPSEYGNAISGVFDLSLRSGNRDKHEFMIQLGAVSGFEMMAEGPLNNNNNGSYIVAGRYSFVGVASDLGWNIGTNASPNYQDLAFKVDLGNSKAGRFTLFGIGGLSDIEFLGEEIDEIDLFAAPDEDAFAESRFGVIGLKHNLLIGEKAYLRTIVASSVSQNQFTQDRYFNLGTDEEIVARYGEADNLESRFSISSYFNQKFSAKLTSRIGILGEIFNYDVESKDADTGSDTDDDGINELMTVFRFYEDVFILQPFAKAQYRLTRKWTLNAGIHAIYQSLGENLALEPRLAINWDFLPLQTLSLGYGLHNQMQPLPILRLESTDADGQTVYTNENLNFTRSQHFVLGYDYKFAPDWRAKVELYYQALDNVPVESVPSSFSMLNAGADFIFPTDKFNLVNEGSGYNTGIELTIEKFFSRGYYGLLTASLFDSKYEGSDGIERNTAFNNNYVVNLLAGKEWKIGKAKRNTFSVDTKLTTAGGRFYTPTDLVASREAMREISDESRAFSLRQSPYFRWDLKFGFQLNSAKKKLSHQFYFDLQNVTNRDNIFLKQYNRQTNEVNDVYQIGFFPDFMYRIQF